MGDRVLMQADVMAASVSLDFRSNCDDRWNGLFPVRVVRACCCEAGRDVVMRPFLKGFIVRICTDDKINVAVKPAKLSMQGERSVAP
ncbi:hypothetical protein HAP47_0002545 [Bradyrhizobium sp. 41S5]|uniref:hypothetical protein n=1 Tax=Bradyrhizobium sp. 41S5 TaxID=1404443 RepID=UPI00156AD799|nr:hypothetical protein [Bradyrhizobium sp. 41S5]UFX45628.1 hypothetical protein HAP47_0002545 [Bradyrhizobium sp. 41S5]